MNESSSFLDIDVGDAQEPVVVPDGEECLVRLIGMTGGINKNNDPYTIWRFDVPDRPNAKEFTKYLPIPTDKMDAKEKNTAKWKFKTYWEAFAVDHTQTINFDNVAGGQCWALLGVSEDDEYGEQNYIKRLITKK